MHDSTTASRLQSEFGVDGSLLIWDPADPDAWLWTGSPVALVDTADAREA